MTALRIGVLSLLAAAASTTFGREWTDSTGHYKISADMIAYSDSTVVLEKKNGDLVAVPVDKLSQADQKYLQNKAADQSLGSVDSAPQIWTFKSGLRVPAKIVDFAERDVTLQRRLGHLYVNDQRFDKLPGVYREMLPRIVAHYTGSDVEGELGLQRWSKQLRGQPQTFHLNGVLLELEDGHLYGVPFFFFSDADQETFKPGWERWVAAKKDSEEQDRQSFLLQAQVEAREREKQEMRQIQQLQLNLQAYAAGLFGLWEVTMYPPAGSYGMPLSVVVPAQDSEQASMKAQMLNPGYVVDIIRQVGGY